MTKNLNVLILSCGSRNKIVQYFKKELAGNGKVIATDCSPLAPALYEADKHYIVPRMDSDEYLDVILSICKKNNIKAVFSLIDPELSFLAKHKQVFKSIEVVPIVSDFDVVEICFDKYKMFEFLTRNGFETAKSYIEKDKFYSDLENDTIKFPLFVKPVRGSASNNISKVSSIEEIEFLFKDNDNLMIQEFMDGIEYGADVYIDMISNEPVAIFAKEKIKMRAGETDKAVSVKDEKLFELIKRLVKELGLKGIIDIDIFKVNGGYFISEVNPRFGGGYPHAYECEVNIPKMIVKNLCQHVNEVKIGEYDDGIYMMKFNEVKIYKEINVLSN